MYTKFKCQEDDCRMCELPFVEFWFLPTINGGNPVEIHFFRHMIVLIQIRLMTVSVGRDKFHHPIIFHGHDQTRFVQLHDNYWAFHIRDATCNVEV